MKLQSILSFSPELNPAVAVDSNNTTKSEYISTNLPPIQKSNLNNKCKLANSDIPEFLEPTPLIEDYCFKKTFATSVPFNIFSKEVPSLIPSSSSSCSSESSTPSTPHLTACAYILKLQPLSCKAKLVRTCENNTKTLCRNVYLPHIKPKPDKEMQETSAISKCPVAMEHSEAGDSKLALSPTMMAASTSAIAACNQDYSQFRSESNLSASVGSSDENVCDINQALETNFKNSNAHNESTKYKQSASNKRLKFNSNINNKRSKAVDRLMFLTKNAHIKRPRNAWIHFRCHYGQALKTNDPTLRAEEISKRASRRWALLNENEKKPWHQLAEQDKQAHKQAFPNYKYCPRRSNSAAIIARQNTASMHDQMRPKSMMPLCSTFEVAQDMKMGANPSSPTSFLDKLAKSRMMKE